MQPASPAGNEAQECVQGLVKFAELFWRSPARVSVPGGTKTGGRALVSAGGTPLRGRVCGQRLELLSVFSQRAQAIDTHDVPGVGYLENHD